MTDVRFCGGADGDGHLFWDCTFPPLVGIREHPEFHGLKEMDKSHRPRCLIWSEWWLSLGGEENPAGSYTSGLLAGWQLRAVFDAEEAADRAPDELDVWTDGSLVQFRSGSQVLVLRVLFFFFF